jgi:hypothetical protein
MPARPQDRYYPSRSEAIAPNGGVLFDVELIGRRVKVKFMREGQWNVLGTVTESRRGKFWTEYLVEQEGSPNCREWLSTHRFEILA